MKVNLKKLSCLFITVVLLLAFFGVHVMALNVIKVSLINDQNNDERQTGTGNENIAVLQSAETRAASQSGLEHEAQESEETNTETEGSESAAITEDEWFELQFESDHIEGILIEKSERYWSVANEENKTYKIMFMGSFWGYISVDTYSFLNGDLYYYIKYTPMNDNSGDIALIIPYILDSFDIRTIEYPEKLDHTASVIKLYEKQSVSENILNDGFLPGSVYIDSESLNCFFSYTSVYDRKPYEIRGEQYDKAQGIKVTEKGIKITLPSNGANSFSEQWGIISREKLVNWDDQIAVADIRIADLSRVRKWGGDGQYYNLPVGYSPYSSTGFYRNSANHIGNKFISVNGRLFEDFGFVTMATLIKTQNYQGYWSTTPIADWLYRDYKIGAGFFDTRWDTEGALSLLRGYRKFNEPRALEGACIFADFFCNFTLNNSYKTKNGGILVYDYGFDPMPNIKTHVSLNHLLNEMNFLYEMYIATKNETYLATANKILQGVRDTASSWMNKKTGDLHYAYMGNGRYGLTDYPTLTLNDLKYSQNLIKQIFGREDESIAKLIDIKEKYLRKHNIKF